MAGQRNEQAIGIWRHSEGLHLSITLVQARISELDSQMLPNGSLQRGCPEERIAIAIARH